jgi:hypothetical protein
VAAVAAACALTAVTVWTVARGQDPTDGDGPPVLRAVDGGADYYERFTPGLPAGDGYFPIGVWFESVVEPGDAGRDAEAGLNLYVQVTDTTDLDLIASEGMHVIHERVGASGDQTVGWLLPDEPDMWAGPGGGTWTGAFPGEGDVCAGGRTDCGYTVQTTAGAAFPDDGRLRYANYGKGVLYWLSDQAAARFVNQYQDVVSADAYWYTDRNICGPNEGELLLGRAGRALTDDLCHRAANYGLTVERVRDLVEPPGSRPVWAFVEVGHPFTNDDWPTITPGQIRAAVWSSLIHGARGIVYFNHSFGGDCESQHVLRDPCYAQTRAAVTELNRQITDLAPVLNAPFVDRMTSVTGPVDAATKYHDGVVHVLAGATSAEGGSATFSLECFDGATVTVLGESRVLTMAEGRFTDEFADGEAVHLYRVDGAPSCGLE